MLKTIIDIFILEPEICLFEVTSFTLIQKASFLIAHLFTT